MSFIPTYGPEDAPRLEETPGREDAPDTETSAGQDRAASLRRIPNIGHALVFVCFTGVVLVLLELVLVALGRAPGTEHDGVAKLLHPKLQIALLATTYLTTLLAAWIFYPLVWQRRFLDGLQWRWAVARNQAAKLVSLGLLLGVTMQAVTYFITPPKTLPVDDFFHTQTDAWLITLFGTIVAPIFEEVCFRGFLLPAFAIAYDWLSLPRTEQARANLFSCAHQHIFRADALSAGGSSLGRAACALLHLAAAYVRARQDRLGGCVRPGAWGLQRICLSHGDRPDRRLPPSGAHDKVISSPEKLQGTLRSFSATIAEPCPPTRAPRCSTLSPPTPSSWATSPWPADRSPITTLTAVPPRCTRRADGLPGWCSTT
jgi:membrane protease YdiL (CAAX protease family)